MPALAPHAKGRLTPLDTSPSRYIARIDHVTGAERPGPIHPDELLVHAHRDHHPVDITVQFLASRLVGLTGSEWLAEQSLRCLNGLGGRLAATIGLLLRDPSLEWRTREVLDIGTRDFFFRFRESSPLPANELGARIASLRRDACAALAALGPKPQLHILLTGGAGFLGKEVLVQSVDDPHVAEVVCLLRPERVLDPLTGRFVEVVHAQARGARLLQRLGIRGAAARRIRFVEGDVERPGLGLRAAEASRLRRSLTHVVHCAASVAFDESYESSFRANVIGSRNALAFSLDLQRVRGSPFVAHVAVETSYIHGRLRHDVAREDRLAFPAHFYNNFYELTKAMAAIETERTMLERGLRVVAAPALDRDRGFPDRQQPRRHQGRQRPRERPGSCETGPRGGAVLGLAGARVGLARRRPRHARPGGPLGGAEPHHGRPGGRRRPRGPDRTPGDRWADPPRHRSPHPLGADDPGDRG